MAKCGQPSSFLLQGPRGLLGPKGPPGPPGPPVRPVTSARLSTLTLAQGYLRAAGLCCSQAESPPAGVASRVGTWRPAGCAALPFLARRMLLSTVPGAPHVLLGRFWQEAARGSGGALSRWVASLGLPHPMLWPGGSTDPWLIEPVGLFRTKLCPVPRGCAIPRHVARTPSRVGGIFPVSTVNSSAFCLDFLFFPSHPGCDRDGRPTRPERKRGKSPGSATCLLPSNWMGIRGGGHRP